MTAEGSVYRRKDGRWVAQYRDARDKVRYVYRKTRGEAKKALREALQDRDEGYVPADKLTVGLYVEGWMEDRRDTVSARTWRVQESMVRNRVNPYIGDVRLCKLTPADVRGMYRSLLSDGLTPSTVGRVHAILKQTMRDAVRDKHIRDNPLEDVKAPKQERKEKHVDSLTGRIPYSEPGDLGAVVPTQHYHTMDTHQIQAVAVAEKRLPLNVVHALPYTSMKPQRIPQMSYL